MLRLLQLVNKVKTYMWGLAMKLLSLLAASLATLGFYLSSPHQGIWPGAAGHAGRLRAGAILASVCAVLLAGIAYGAWCGLLIALSGLMLVLVALPYLDAWRRQRSHHAV